MTLTDISEIRLSNQHVSGAKLKTAKEIVNWMGAIQAQDFSMSKWAVGIRLPGSTEKVIEQAINNGEVIRTHLLRPTWHLVSPDDIYWMLELSAAHIKTAMKSRDTGLGLTPDVIKKSNSIIEKALQKEKFVSRDELVKKFETAGIRNNENRAAHLLMHAELNALICSGETKGSKQTYTLLAERVKRKKSLKREEALSLLAKRYFTSHCPATLDDFIWWSGLSAAEGKLALEMVKTNFISETIGGRTYWFNDSITIPKQKSNSAYLIPAFDEFLISYKDRTASLSVVHNRKAVSINGIFWPVIVINGQVKGIWKRTIKKNKITVEADFFNSPGKADKNLIAKILFQYGNFMEREIEIVYKKNV